MTTLRHYIERLTVRRATISFEEIRALVESAPRIDTRRDHSFTRRRTLMISGILSVLTLMTFALLVPRNTGSDSATSHNAARSVITPAATATATTGSTAASTDRAASDREAAPEGTPAPTTRDLAIPTSAAAHEASPTSFAPEDSASGRARTALGGADSLAFRIEPASEEERKRMLAAHAPSSDGLDVTGVRTLQLPADVLARLGIVAEEDGVWVTMAENQMPMQIGRHGTRIFAKPERLGHTLPTGPFAATLVTDDLGAYRSYDYEASDVPEDLARRLEETPRDTHEWWLLQQQVDSAARARFAREIGSLVPILVTSIEKEDPSAKESGWRPDVIIWFRPVPGFLDLLPAEARAGIEKELREAKRRSEEAGGATERPEAQPRRMTGERPYLDLLRASDGAIVATSLAPNPTRDRSTLTIELRDARTVSIAVMDIQGREVRPVARGRGMSAGKESVMIDVAGLKSGIYLVAVSTDRGEQAVQRIIIPQ